MTDMNSSGKNHRSSSGSHNRSARKGRILMDSVELSEVIEPGNPIDVNDGLERSCAAAHHSFGHPMAHSSSSYRHHPNCATNYRAFSSSAHNNFAHSDSGVDMLCLTPEAYEAGEAIEFIAEHLKSEDEYIQVGVKSRDCQANALSRDAKPSFCKFHRPIRVHDFVLTANAEIS